MSIQFNDTATRKGLIQLIERETGLGTGRISGDTELLKDFTADINIAFDNLLRIIFKYAGTWQYDDTNHTDYPFIKTNLIAGQRDYSFFKDEQGNIILDIHKVMVKDDSGLYREVKPVDMQSDKYATEFYDESGVTGDPSEYDKTGNGIIFDVIPSKNITDGIKIFINREPLYFTYSDTTKIAGVDGLCQEYLALEPSLRYAERKSLSNLQSLKERVNKLEKQIAGRYYERARDERKIIRPILRSSE